MSDSEDEFWEEQAREQKDHQNKMTIAHQTFINKSLHQSIGLKIYRSEIQSNFYITIDDLSVELFAQFPILKRDELDMLEYIQRESRKSWLTTSSQPLNTLKINRNGKHQLEFHDNDPEWYIHYQFNDLICNFYKNPIKPISLVLQAGKCALLNIGDRGFLKKHNCPSLLLAKMEHNLIHLRFHKPYPHVFQLNFEDSGDKEIVIELEKSLFETFKSYVDWYLNENLETRKFFNHRPYCSSFSDWNEFIVWPDYESMNLEKFQEIMLPIFEKARDVILNDIKSFKTSCVSI